MTSEPRAEPDAGSDRITRRDVLARGGILAGALAVAPSLAGGGQAQAAVRMARTASSKKATKLVVGFSDVPTSLDPDGPDSYYEPNFLQSVNTYAPPLALRTAPNAAKLGGGLTVAAPATPVPALLTTWAWTGKAWRFRVRPGVKSAAGNELTAEDFAWTFNRSVALKAVAGYEYGAYNAVAVKVIDKYTYELVTSAPSPNLPLMMAAIPSCAPIDSVEAKKHATPSDPWASTWLSANTAGFGPYVVTQWVKGQVLTLAARGDYYGGAPHFKEITVQAVPQTSTLFAALRSGAIDLALELPPDLIASAQRTKGLKVVQFKGNSRHTFIVNYKYGPPALTDRRVHQALAYAIPYQTILQNIYRGQGAIAKTLMAPYVVGATDKYWHYKTNVAQAKQLLSQAGWSQGFAVDFTFPSDSAEMEQVAPILQSAWAQIGVTTTLNGIPTAQMQTEEAAKMIPLWITDTGAVYVPNPSEVALFFQKNSYANYANYDNPQMDTAYGELVRAFDKKTQVRLSGEVQALVERDLPEPGLLWFWNSYAMKDNIENYVYTVEHMPRFAKLTAS